MKCKNTKKNQTDFGHRPFVTVISSNIDGKKP
jgi:hypothetical protein